MKRQLKIINKITERTPTIDKYLSEISPIRLITPEEETLLAQKIKKGDKKAEHQLIQANLRFVVSCAKQYQNRGLSLDDLIAEGNLGLIKAAEKFDETRGFKFISYAVNWIRQSIIHAINQNSRIIRMPQNRIQQLNELKDLLSKMSQENDGTISVENICSRMGIDMQTYDKLLKTNGSVSLDKKMSEDEEGTLYDVLADEDADLENHLTQISIKEQLRMALSCLGDLEKSVITDFFGLNNQHKEFTMNELAEKYGYSSEGIRQIKQKSLTKMKRFMCDKYSMTEIEK